MSSWTRWPSRRPSGLHGAQTAPIGDSAPEPCHGVEHLGHPLVDGGVPRGEHPDLAGELSAVVVDRVLLELSVGGEADHIASAQAHVPPRRLDALERAAVEGAGARPLYDRVPVVLDDVLDRHLEVGDGGQELSEESFELFGSAGVDPQGEEVVDALLGPVLANGREVSMIEKCLEGVAGELCRRAGLRGGGHGSPPWSALTHYAEIRRDRLKGAGVSS